MNKIIQYALIFAAGMTSLPTFAHISYNGRDFGNYDLSTGGSSVVLNQFVTGNYGWIDGTDADQGNSHAVLPFRFTLTSDATVSLSFWEDSAMTTNYKGEEALSLYGLTPGFTLYRGLAHVAPAGADYDTTEGSILLRPTDSEGSFVALGDWSVTNEEDPQALNPSYFTYIGHAYDGAADYGNGLIPGGDGVADHSVSKIFQLTPGDYSIFVSGSDYWDQLVSDQPRYGLNASFNIVQQIPEPGMYALLLAGLLGLSSMTKRRELAY